MERSTHIIRIQQLLDVTMGLLESEREIYPIESWEDFQIEAIAGGITNAQAAAMVLKHYLESEEVKEEMNE